MQPRRSVLYMPGANARALEKAKTLKCDSLILDMEDAVAPSSKVAAREQIVAAVNGGGYGYRELVARVNGLQTPWGHDDLSAVASLAINAVLFPKIESAAEVDACIAALDAAGGSGLPLWLMVETPRGVLNCASIAAVSDRVEVVVMGTSDLVKELRARHTPERHNLDYALQTCVTAARAANVEIVDGVHLDFRNLETFQVACESGRSMGFDGKTLIHPSQIDIANEVFGFPDDAIAHAREVISVWEQAQADGRGVVELDGKLIENLHAAEAERVLALAEAVAARG
ncbi:MAG: CoA ester lyase [Pseudomonadota bacterium]